MDGLSSAKVAEDTLWSYQKEVRHGVNALQDAMVCSPETKEVEDVRPSLSHIEEMIEFEKRTLVLLEEVVKLAQRLGRK